MNTTFKVSKEIESKCAGCGRKDVEHYARGLCKNCYDSWNRQNRWVRNKDFRTLRNPHCTYCGARPVKQKNPPVCSSCLKTV